MAKLPLLPRLLLSAMRRQASLRSELKQTNRLLAKIADALIDTNRLRRRELGLALEGIDDLPPSASGGPNDRSDLSPDPRFNSRTEFEIYAVAEDEAQKFRERYFRDPTDDELALLVAEAQYGREAGGSPAAAPGTAKPSAPRPRLSDPPPPDQPADVAEVK